MTLACVHSQALYSNPDLTQVKYYSTLVSLHLEPSIALDSRPSRPRLASLEHPPDSCGIIIISAPAAASAAVVLRLLNHALQEELDASVAANVASGNTGIGGGYGLSKAALCALTLVQARQYPHLKVPKHSKQKPRASSKRVQRASPF